jgi:hypothetical protein
MKKRKLLKNQELILKYIHSQNGYTRFEVVGCMVWIKNNNKGWKKAILKLTMQLSSFNRVNFHSAED